MLLPIIYSLSLLLLVTLLAAKKYGSYWGVWVSKPALSLVPAGNRMFLAGLVSFLGGHLLYIAAFYQVALLDRVLLLPALVILLANIAIYNWLKEYILELKGPVLTYMLVISVMVLAASAVAINGNATVSSRVLILGGAMSFFVSDLFVIRERSVQRTFVNAALGLPLYYGGQFALAISLGYVT